MRWIERGPEPDGVQEYAQEFTQGWVDYYQHGCSEFPNDSHWRKYRRLLGSYSNDNCWYCERRCQSYAEDIGKAPTVDHFRPKSRFPALVYVWSNWMFSCSRCNVENKMNLWPPSGYVDPSASEVQERPEQYFDYDAMTGEIVPSPGLTAEAHERAMQTIDDLGLNKLDVMFYRIDWMRGFIADFQELPIADRQAFVEFSTSHDAEFVGSMLMAARQLQASRDS